MDYAQQQRNPVRHLTGLAIVFLLHAIVIYALVNGLARKVVEVIKAPLETKIIEEVKPPPPDVPPPPPPKFAAPPPPYVPPPEVQVQAPAVQQNAISSITSTAPTGPTPIAAPRVDTRPAAPAIRQASGNCSVMVPPTYPPKADADGVSAVLKVQFNVTARGEPNNIRVSVLSMSNPGATYRRMFERNITDAVQQYRCASSDAVTFEQEFVFKPE
jgi:protein TonB